jgi:hypothetical protein
VKTAIYIEDGVTQVVLTPETEWEKKAIKTMEDRFLKVRLFAGEFYDCRGGWVRQKEYHPHYTYGSDAHRDYSLILRIEPETTDTSDLRTDRQGSAADEAKVAPT